jgi:hypothetical protein
MLLSFYHFTCCIILSNSTTLIIFFSVPIMVPIHPVEITSRRMSTPTLEDACEHAASAPTPIFPGKTRMTQTTHGTVNRLATKFSHYCGRHEFVAPQHQLILLDPKADTYTGHICPHSRLKDSKDRTNSSGPSRPGAGRAHQFPHLSSTPKTLSPSYKTPEVFLEVIDAPAQPRYWNARSALGGHPSSSDSLAKVSLRG